MQIITLDSGKTFEVKFIGAVLRGGNRLMIELKDDRSFATIAKTFDGVQTITQTDDITPGREIVFKGFTRLVGMARNTAGDKAVRLTLEKDDAV